MKILHAADWHLGKRLDNFPRLEEQKEVLQEICDIADKEGVHAVLIAGDLFDTFNPPIEAVELFYKTLKKLANNGKRVVIAIAGNHDSPDRIEAPDPLARECGIIFVGYPYSKVNPFKLDSGFEIITSEEGFIELILPEDNTHLRVLLTPYASEYRLKKYLGIEDPEKEFRKVIADFWKEKAEKYCNSKGVNILLAHIYMMRKGGEMLEEPDDEKPILHLGGAQAIYTESIPQQIQYVALGHLHRKQVVAEQPCPVLYSSSPLAYSFSEANQDKYVIIIKADLGQPVELNPVKLTKGKRLVRKRFEDIEEAVKWLLANPDTLVELTMVTETFLSSQERMQLHNIHEGIVSIIPEVKDLSILENGEATTIDLSSDTETLFKQYFQFKHGQEPNKRLIELFKEVLAEEAEE